MTREVPLLDARHQLAALIAAEPGLARALEAGEERASPPAPGAARHADVVFACTHEGALRLEDVLERRLRLTLTAPDRGLAAAGPAAELMAGALGWSREQTRRELESYRADVESARAGEAERTDEAALRAATAERTPA